MDNIAQRLKAYIEAHPFDPGDSNYETVLDQLYQVYQESHESDPPDIRDGFRELDNLLGHLPLEDNNSVFNLCCSLCTAYEHKASAALCVIWLGGECGQDSLLIRIEIPHLRKTRIL